MTLRTVLIIDDEDKLRKLLSRIIELEGFEVIQASDLKTGLKKLALSPIDVVLCDVKLPDGNGVDFTQVIKDKYPLIEVILLTAYGNIPDGVKAIKNGAYDYITKGDDNNKILPLLYRAFERVKINKKVVLPSDNSKREQQIVFDRMIGKAPLFLQAIKLAERVAPTDATVLLTGETGTGKEVFAQAIHQGSQRIKGSFVAINCSAFSKDLLESEMFGHRAGAFTNATKDQKGLFEEANHGTIFLDEIGEMALDLQAKLLRVLETGEFLKIGDTKPTKVNVRIIAATNRSFEKEIALGNFREDLFYRISVFQIELPALRNRMIDIPLLVDYFIGVFSSQSNAGRIGISAEANEALQMHEWPGNIRELKNVIERALILANTKLIELNDLPFEFQQMKSKQGKSLSAFELASAEKLHIQKVLQYTNGNKTKTAELLGIALTTLYRKLAEYEIN